MSRRPSRRPSPAGVVPGLVLAALLSGLGAAAGPGAVAAGPDDRKREVDAGISALQEDLVGTSAELQAAYAALAESQAQLPVAEAALALAESDLAEAEREDAALATRLAAAEQAEANMQVELAADAEAIVDTEDSIGRLASEAYRSGGMSAGVSAVIASEDPDEFADRYVMANSVQRHQNNALYRLQSERAVRANAQARLAAVEAEVAELRRQAAEVVVSAAEARATAAERRAEVDRLVAARVAASQAVVARQAEEQARLGQLQTEQQALGAELARLAEEARRAEQARLAEQARRDSAAGRSAARAAPPAASDGVLQRPTSGRVTSGYGFRIHPISGARRLHAGVDLAAGCGTPVVAAASGTVVSAGYAGGYGNRILVNHGLVGDAGLATSYNHLSGYAVRSGSVSRGQVIGYEGTTGASTGCHLHFEVYVDGATVDPMGWL
ncbi:MAG TPA: peptidoglycan DD-metalloendopeptidase family protein [Mycobacteriales bacterium]|jgi:murein DD-endopeptidase MepM/ murein hydrolase activator NlpD|nr:peptidoglycan DD-metalloendopeptidase family protein [Mycobacteriales bacterium]